jgi:hypothetical protein
VNVVKRRRYSINTGTVFLCTTIHHRSKNYCNSLNFSIKSFCISLCVDYRAIIPSGCFTWKKKRWEFKVSPEVGFDFVDRLFFETDEANWTPTIESSSSSS